MYPFTIFAIRNWRFEIWNLRMSDVMRNFIRPSAEFGNITTLETNLPSNCLFSIVQNLLLRLIDISETWKNNKLEVTRTT
jgi:hypothetical protein